MRSLRDAIQLLIGRYQFALRAPGADYASRVARALAAKDRVMQAISALPDTEARHLLTGATERLVEHYQRALTAPEARRGEAIRHAVQARTRLLRLLAYYEGAGSRGTWNLVGLLVAAALSAGVLTGAYLLFTTSASTYRYVAQRVEVQQDSRATLEWLMRVVRNASVVIRAERHAVIVQDPDGMRVGFENPDVVFLYAGADGAILTPPLQPSMVRLVTVTYGPFQATAHLRGAGGERGPWQDLCGREGAVADWNVWCRP